MKDRHPKAWATPTTALMWKRKEDALLVLLGLTETVCMHCARIGCIRV